MKRTLAVALAAILALGATAAGAAITSSFLASLKTLSRAGSTVPANGDLNPYGIVALSSTEGALRAGDLLVSNFNAKSNDQGTGTTLVEVGPHPALFAQIAAASLPGACPGGVGLTTALAVLPGGYVVVGSLPTSNGKSATAKAGCLIVLDDHGRPVQTIAGGPIQGPWDMTATVQGDTTTLFVSMALNGGAAAGLHVVDNSTVVRLRLVSGPGRPPRLVSEQVIADGFPWRDDPSALVIGPTGVALAANGTLYVANTLANQIDAVPDAMTRTTPVTHGGVPVSTGGQLNQPLGLALAPDGDILTTNAGNGKLVETALTGRQVSVFDTRDGAGALFGLAVTGAGVYLVDDASNTVQLLH